MSAGKLEKKLAALERRMREEMHGELSSLYLRLQAIEEKIRMEHPTPFKQHLDASALAKSGLEIVQDVSIPGSVLNAVVPSTDMDAKKHQQHHEDGERIQVFQPQIREIEEEDQDEEPIPFQETVWNVVLVLGFTGAGWMDILLTLVLAVGSIFMQVMFIWVLCSPSFVGGEFRLEIAAARAWRASIAHDAKYRDLSGTSLASRVCNGDGSLIQSNEQANLLSDINQFLGNGSESFSRAGLPPGIILSGLCILLWCMYLSKEFRAIWISVEASLQMPRARRTVFNNGRFIAVSYARLVVFLTLRLYRVGVAGLLLYAGQQWLAKTTNITDLILNAAALGTILEIDEVVFSSMLPKKIQAAVYDLEAIKVRYTRVKSQLEAAVVFIGVVAMCLLPLFVWVLPLTEMMEQVKVEFCYGNQDFVVTYNQDVQQTVGLMTASFAGRYEDGLSLSERAVLQQTVPSGAGDDGNTSNMYHGSLIHFSDGPLSFAKDSVASMAVVAEELPSCLDADNWLRAFGPVFAKSQLSRFHSTAVLMGRDNATSCAELADKCEDWDSRLLRGVCGRTCGCHLPSAMTWFKVPEQGCPTMCRGEATALAKEIPCEDAPISDEWLSFWDKYPDIMSRHLGVNLSSPQAPAGAHMLRVFVDFMKATGCRGLLSAPDEIITRTTWCTGNQYVAPLAHICPVSCGCRVDNPPAHCPQSCKACGDTANFPSGSGIDSCLQAKAFGICGIPDHAVELCAGTCGLCSGNASVSSVCPDGPLPPFYGLGSCADIKAAGWCPLLEFLGSSVRLICGRSCGACT